MSCLLSGSQANLGTEGSGLLHILSHGSSFLQVGSENMQVKVPNQVAIGKVIKGEKIYSGSTNIFIPVITSPPIVSMISAVVMRRHLAASKKVKAQVGYPTAHSFTDVH